MNGIPGGNGHVWRDERDEQPPTEEPKRRSAKKLEIEIGEGFVTVTYQLVSVATATFDPSSIDDQRAIARIVGEAAGAAFLRAVREQPKSR